MTSSLGPASAAPGPTRARRVIEAHVAHPRWPFSADRTPPRFGRDRPRSRRSWPCRHAGRSPLAPMRLGRSPIRTHGSITSCDRWRVLPRGPFLPPECRVRLSDANFELVPLLASDRHLTRPARLRWPSPGLSYGIRVSCAALDLVVAPCLRVDAALATLLISPGVGHDAAVRRSSRTRSLLHLCFCSSVSSVCSLCAARLAFPSPLCPGDRVSAASCEIVDHRPGCGIRFCPPKRLYLIRLAIEGRPGATTAPLPWPSSKRNRPGRPGPERELRPFFIEQI